LSWEISNSLSNEFCKEALRKCFKQGIQPEIFNTGQGAQFTANDFREMLLERQIGVSMDSKGRALDNILIERFWRSLKYEDIYLKEYTDGKALYEGILEYVQFYNYQRKHQSLDYLTPDEVFYQKTLIS
jgi:putative transposase